jgi:hypothetical protein
MATVGASLAVGAAGAGASYLIGQANKPKAYNPGANNYLAQQQQKALSDLAARYQGQVAGYGNTFLEAEKGLANTYSGQGSGASNNYLTNTGNYLNRYSGNIANLAAGAPQNEFNAAQTGLGFNINNLGLYGGIANNLSNQAQNSQIGLVNNALPSWQQQYSQGMENAGQMQQGLIASDVQGNVGRTAGFNALQSGTRGGSGLGRNLTARDLGLTSMQLQQQGTSQAQSLAQQQYGMEVAGLLTNPNAIYQTSGVNSGQAMNAGALGTNLAATGLQTGLQGGLSTQGTNFGQMMGLYGNVFNTGVGANQSVMNAEAQAAAVAAEMQAQGITGNYGTQMNGNLMQYQSNNQLAAYNNNLNQGLLTGLTSTIGTALPSFISNGGMNFLSGIGNGGLQSNGFYNSAGAAQSAYGTGANIGSYNQAGGGVGYYNKYYS